MVEREAMISPDLAETVKRIAELAAKATPGPWGSQDGAYPHDGYVVITAPTMNARSPLATVNMLGDENEARADAAYIAAANPKAMAELLDALERLEQGTANLSANCKTAVDTAAEYARKVGKLEAQLAAITTERRTPGTVEVCEFAMPNRHGGQRCINAAMAGWRCDIEGCPVKRIQHPTPSQGTTPEKEGGVMAETVKCEDCGSTEDVMQVKVRRPHLLCRRCVATLPAEVLKLAEIKDARSP